MQVFGGLVISHSEYWSCQLSSAIRNKMISADWINQILSRCCFSACTTRPKPGTTSLGLFWGFYFAIYWPPQNAREILGSKEPLNAYQLLSSPQQQGWKQLQIKIKNKDSWDRSVMIYISRLHTLPVLYQIPPPVGERASEIRSVCLCDKNSDQCSASNTKRHKLPMDLFLFCCVGALPHCT